MGTAASENDAANGGAAGSAGLAGALIDAMLELEESPGAFGIDVIGDRGAAHPDGVFQDLAKCLAQAVEFGAGETAGGFAGADAGAKEAFVGIDVAHAREQFLVEEGGLDGDAAAAKQGGELSGADGEGLGAGSRKTGFAGEIPEFEAPEPARVDESQFTATGQREPRMRMGSNRRVGRGNQQSPGHAEMNDPLCRRRLCRWQLFCRLRRFAAGWTQFEDDVLSGAMDIQDSTALELASLAGGGRFERFAMGGKPGFDNAVPANPGVDTAGDRFHLGQFGHDLILRAHEAGPPV